MNINEAQIINQKIRLLHIDDEPLQLDNLRFNLELVNNNFIVESETDIIKAINKIKENNYDCVLLDYLMPVYDDIDTASKIRTISDVPIILYTIQEFDDIIEKIFDVGINDYLHKDPNEGNYIILEKKILNLVKNNRHQKIFAKILKNITDSIVMLDNDANIIYFNDVFRNTYGEDNLIGKSVLNVIEELHKEAFSIFLLNEDHFIATVIENSKKVKYDVEINKSIININKEFIILNIKNVTEPSLKSDIVNSSDERFFAIANMSPDAIATVNMWGYVTYINEAFSRLTGFSENEIVGKHMLTLPTMAGRDLKPYLNLVKSFFSGNLSKESIEFPYTRKDGSPGIGDGYVNIIKINNKREIIAIIKDITDKKKKEEEYQIIYKSSPEGIIHLDINGEIKDINYSASNLLQIDPIDYIGKKIYEFEDIFEQNKIDFKNILENILNNKPIEPFEIELKLNNNILYVEFKVGQIKIFDEVLGIQIILRDVTQQKNIEKQRIAYTEKLETLVQERTIQIVDNEKMVAMSKVSSMIAHDIKGPLQVIQNTLYLIKIKPENMHDYLEFIGSAVKQANDLIEEMLAKGKQTPLYLEDVSLTNLIDESLLQVKVSENVTFETLFDSERIVQLDKSKFIRVFNNLFKNAVEAMPNGGKITILVEEKGNYIYIKIMDTGTGIPQNKLDTLFRPFQSTKSKGMGLGLTYCKNTVESHGGTISVESEVGKGTTFIITIPIIKDEIKNLDENVMNIKDTLIE